MEWSETASGLVDGVAHGKKNVGARYVDFSEDDAGKLGAALAGSTTERLTLVNANLNAKKFALVAGGLAANKSLKYLNLNGNAIGNEGAKALAAALAESKINEVFLTGNNITDEGGKALLELVKSNTNVQGLDVDGNRIEKGVVAAIRKAADDNL